MSIRFDAILFDFDGVLIDSEWFGNTHLAEYLTASGHPTTLEHTIRFMGLAGEAFRAAVADWLGGPLPADFDAALGAASERALAEGIAEVSGAVAFVRALPAELPIAVVSSSTTHWIGTHLAHIGLADRFGVHVYSGREHVARGKPAPDIYLHAAKALGVDIADCAIIEDSPVGATGAVASGAHVIGLCAGRHCPPRHGDTLRAIGAQDIAASFDEVQRIVSVSPGAS
jgi:HAD superfamily hydrolase (TIGR01509 family)